MSNRLKSLREARGLSRRALAELVNTGSSQIVKLEAGDRRLSDHWAQRIAPHLGVEPYELFMRDVGRSAIRWAPVLGEVSCGNWKEAIEHASEAVPTMAAGPNVFALRPVGDSMNLVINEGGYAIVDPDQIDLIDGKIYVVSNGSGDTTAKRYKASPARLVPASSNPEHEEILIGRQMFTVVGRIVELSMPT